MQFSNHVILFGTGHLAFQVARKLQFAGLPLLHIGSEHFQTANKLPEESVVEHLRRTLREAHIHTARAVFILDDEDRYNIQAALIVLSLNESVPVFVSLFNAELAVHLRAGCENVVVLNPAGLATKVFVDALYASITRKRDLFRHLPARHRVFTKPEADRWFYALVIAFVALLIGGTIVFHFTEKLSFVDAFYFVVTLMTTTGFGDISLRNSSTFAKLFGTVLMVGAVGLLSMTFSFIVDRLFKKRSEIALGRKRYKLRDHVILCGLGRVGYEVVQELLRRKEIVLVIEKDPENRFLESVRSQGARTFVGDASVPKVLRDAGVNKACGLFSLINDDLKNLEIGLNARSLCPDLRLILRIFDTEIADQLKERLDIHFAMSTSAIAAEEFAALLNASAGAEPPRSNALGQQ